MRYDYTNSKVDYSNLERINFYRNLSDMIIFYNSTSDEVNELINWFYAKAKNCSYHDHSDIRNYNLSKDKIINKNTIRREVSNDDIRLWGIFTTLQETNSWKDYDDCLFEIVDKIYFKLDTVIHPYLETERDMIDSRYYVELEYIDE